MKHPDRCPGKPAVETDRRNIILRCIYTRFNREYIALLAIALLLASCSEKGGDEDLKLSDPVYGFYLGETRTELFKRARGKIEWEKIKNPRGDFRGDLYNFSGVLIDTPEVSHARLAFLDGYLMEVIVYFRDTSVSRMRMIKRHLEKFYEMKPTSPDGTREKVYKTYRFYAPGTSITLRRFTKLDETELFIQFLHKELDGRLREIQEKKNPAAKSSNTQQPGDS